MLAFLPTPLIALQKAVIAEYAHKIPQLRSRRLLRTAPKNPRGCAIAVRSWCSIALGVGFSFVAQAQANDAPQMNLPRIEMGARMHRIQAQVAQSPIERQTGLMHRTSMPEQEGMLFVFEQAGVQCFWMKNTRLPLTAAFVDDDGTIVNMADMAPMTENSHCSAKPVRFVLEMNQGWFAKRRISAGMKITGAPFRKPVPAGNNASNQPKKLLKSEHSTQ
jgi:uncharacterized membrane protein (UPF0127 family)